MMELLVRACFASVNLLLPVYGSRNSLAGGVKGLSPDKRLFFFDCHSIKSAKSFARLPRAREMNWIGLLEAFQNRASYL
jgi:hypothetical protein